MVSVEWQVEKKEIIVSSSLYSSVLPRRALEETLYKDGHRNTNFKGQEIGLTRSFSNTPPPFSALGSQYTPNSEIGVATIDDPSLLYGASGDAYSLSPAAQRTKDFLNETLGKNLNLQSVEPWTPSDVKGYFVSAGPGGSKDPNNRTIYVRQDVPYPILFHEAGHAGDPALADRDLSIDPSYIKGLRTPSERLDYLFERTGKPKVKSETEAQSFVGRKLPAFQRQNPDLNIKSSDFFDAPYYKEYPASFANNTIDNFYRAELGNIPAQYVVEEDADAGVAKRVFSRSPEQALEYALDQDLRSKEEEVKDFTRNYIDARLNQFQSTPTLPEPGYFSTTR